ncbi:hypothetical protein Mapa_016150 [Marchantia paleacea]|nr:hypothetical protein Mapa_016150 [Marchantia paleacea]
MFMLLGVRAVLRLKVRGIVRKLLRVAYTGMRSCHCIWLELHLNQLIRILHHYHVGIEHNHSVILCHSVRQELTPAVIESDIESCVSLARIKHVNQFCGYTSLVQLGHGRFG